jgi:hypothetical protein
MHNIQSPRTDEGALEQEIQSKGLNAPRLTPEHIDEQIVHAAHYQFPGTTVTVCCLTLRNGYNTVGESACVSPNNFDAEIGKKVAYANAREKIWALEAYLLRDFLHSNRAEFQTLIVGEDSGETD